MGNNNNLLIYQKFLELVYYSNDITKKYPKSEKFNLVKDIKNLLYTNLRLILYAMKTVNKKDKLKFLSDLDVNLIILKVHVRLSYRYQYITLKNYEVWCTKISDIGNMLGAWIISCQKK